MNVLKQLGLTDYEVGVYLALLRQGRSVAKDLSRSSGVPPTAVYPNLHSLIRKGLVQEYTGKISLFEALPLRASLQVYADREMKKITELKTQAILHLEAMKVQKANIPQTPIVVSYGPEISAVLLENYCRTAKRSIYILGWRFRSSKYLYRLLKSLKSAVNRGLDVKILFSRKDGNAKTAANLCVTYGIQRKYHPIHNISIFIQDGSECKLSLKNESLPEQFNIAIQDPDLAGVMKDYFLTLWRKAEKF